jgi:hypothetical protein
LLAPEAVALEGLQDENETGFCATLSIEQRMRELIIAKLFKLFRVFFLCEEQISSEKEKNLF